MTLAMIEGEARWMLRRAGIEDDEPPPILELARRVVGLRVEQVPHRALPGDGQLATLHGERRIYVRTGLPPARLRWAIAHELGHLALSLDSGSPENEDLANAFAAALLAPRRAYQLALNETGPSYTRLARWFITSESCAALRFGEVTDTPLALVAPTRVRVRGAEFCWPLEPTVARIPGVRRATLRDDKRRTAMRIGS
ncbi:MAG TPA: ImmA/IrrE family metallo-endopeptidase [Polyangiaceae bacterium]|nr:ImmA/IrrE family metallo-endopeptidase [Polyangiaceae bacterium]